MAGPFVFQSFLLLPVGRFLEGTDAVIQWGVAGEQPLHQRAGLALGDRHGAHGVRHLIGHLGLGLEAGQGVDHGAGAGELRPGGVGAVLPEAREPGDDGRGDDAEDDLGDHHHREVAHEAEATSPSLRLLRNWSTRWATTRAKNITKVFTTPCTSARVTMSPLATWPISWASTARTSSGRMRLSRPAETATRASFLFQPVAKALDCWAGKMPTSGVLMPASRESSSTVSSSHFSVALLGVSMITVPVLRLAIHLEMNSEIIEPAMPKIKQKISRLLKLMPWPRR